MFVTKRNGKGTKVTHILMFTKRRTLSSLPIMRFGWRETKNANIMGKDMHKHDEIKSIKKCSYEIQKKS